MNGCDGIVERRDKPLSPQEFSNKDATGLDIIKADSSPSLVWNSGHPRQAAAIPAAFARGIATEGQAAHLHRRHPRILQTQALQEFGILATRGETFERRW
jgi:hypothetical protein